MLSFRRTPLSEISLRFCWLRSEVTRAPSDFYSSKTAVSLLPLLWLEPSPFHLLSAPPVTSALYSLKMEAKAWLYRSELHQLLLLPAAASSILSCFLDLQSESIFGWNLSVNCVSFLDLENAVCIGLRLISLAWLPREGNLNLTSQQMCIRFVTSHASFLYKYLNSLSICIPPCWNERQDKRHRDDTWFCDPGSCQELRTGPRP